MSGVWTIFRREIAGLFFTPLAWVVLCLALLFQGLLFWVYLTATQGDVNECLSLALGGGIGFWVLLPVLPPLLTMRMISEEARNGMLEFLLTAPIPDWAVVVGKALAATTVLVLLWGATLVYALVIQLLGGSPDWGLVCGSMIGASMISALFCALGLVASAMSGTPLLAAFLGIVGNVALLMLPLLGLLFRGPSREFVDGAIARLDVRAHLQSSFAAGAFDTADATFFLAWTAVALFLATRLVEARRWS